METIAIKKDGHDIKVHLGPCKHCHLYPSAEDAEKSFHQIVGQFVGCGICGIPPKLEGEFSMYHAVDEESGRGLWVLNHLTQNKPQWDSKMVSMDVSASTGRMVGQVHIDCLRKVAPGIKFFVEG